MYLQDSSTLGERHIILGRIYKVAALPWVSVIYFSHAFIREAVHWVIVIYAFGAFYWWKEARRVRAIYSFDPFSG